MKPSVLVLSSALAACSIQHPSHRLAWASSRPPASAARTPGVLLPGEWEPVDRLVLGWHDESWGFFRTFAELLIHVDPDVQTTLLVPSEQVGETLLSELAEYGVAAVSLEPVVVPLDSMWIRDYGPLVVRTAAGARHVVDLPYGGDRHQDERVPSQLAGLWRWPSTPMALDMEGGHIQADGTGACIVTDDVLIRNAEHHSEGQVRASLRRHFGCERVAVVPALLDEPTGHLDMLAYIVGPGRVLVGDYEPGEDDLNAARLDHGAAILSASGFSVRRVPMPGNDQRTSFRTYTNALIVNGKVFVPVYNEDLRYEAAALSVYREVFAERELVPIVADDLMTLEGSVHCTAMTIPSARSGGGETGLARARPREAEETQGRSLVLLGL